MRKRNLDSILYWSVLTLLIGMSYYTLFRNNRVLHYRNQLAIQSLFVGAELYYEYNDNIYSRYKYHEMLFSFKPLKSRYWFTDEEVRKYRLDLVDNACK